MCDSGLTKCGNGCGGYVPVSKGAHDTCPSSERAQVPERSCAGGDCGAGAAGGDLPEPLPDVP